MGLKLQKGPETDNPTFSDRAAAEFEAKITNENKVMQLF